MSSHNARVVRGNLPNKPIESHAGYTQRGAYVIKESRVSIWQEFPSLVGPAGGQVGVGLKPGGHSGSIILVEWKSGRALRVLCGTARLECWVVRAEFLQTPSSGSLSHIDVRTESLSMCTDL